jgi:hypothetical protein
VLTAGRPNDYLLRTLGARPARAQGGREYVAYPNLAGARWLMPADPRLRGVGLQLYTPQRLRGRLFKRAILTGALRGETVWLEGTSLQELALDLGHYVGLVEPRLAFSLGTPGASQKTTAQLIGNDGSVLAYAKIASSSLAQAALDAEWCNLQRVSAAAPRGHVPAPIHVGTWRDARILIMTAGPARPGPAHLGQPHFDFLRALHLATREEIEFGSSEMFARLSEAIARLGRIWPEPWPRRFAHALKRLEGELGAVRVPLSFAHRDFAPWNTRSGPDGLFVFDWETATEAVVPLYDAFHFVVIQAATRNTRVRSENGYISRLLAAIWPEGEQWLPALYLAYLLDVGLLYGEARVRAPDVGDERVWLSCGNLIDQWLAASRPGP